MDSFEELEPEWYGFTSRLPVGTGLVVARAKLPDDLGLEEYAQIVDDLRTLLGLPSADDDPLIWLESDFPQTTVVRVHYGSDFLAVITTIGSVLAALLTISKILKNLADAGAANEQRKATKQERQRQLSEEPSPAESAHVRDLLRDNGLVDPQTPDAALGKITRLLLRLSRYRISIHVNQQR